MISLYDGNGFKACARHALILIGLGMLLLPGVALGQAQAPKIRIHTGANSQEFLNSHIQAFEKSQQEVVDHRIVLSDKRGAFISASEATGLSGKERFHGISSHSLLAHLLESSTDNVVQSIHAGGFVEDRLRSLQKAIGNAQNPLTILEGNPKTFGVSLTAQPTENVTITIAGHKDTDLQVSPTELTFDNLNWNVKQTVTVEENHDDDDAGETVKLTFTISGNATSSIGENMTIQILDDEHPWELVPLSLLEGSKKSFEVPLLPALAPPSGNVTFTITGQEGTKLFLDQTTLMFPEKEWQQNQSVSLGSTPNAEIADEHLTLTFTASGGGYTGLKYTKDITILDRAPDELLIPEGSTIEEYSYRIYAFPPKADHLIADFSGHDGTDLTVNPEQLIFRKDTWGWECDQISFLCSGWESVTLTAGEDDDAVDDQFLLRSTITGPPGELHVNSSVLTYIRIEDNDDPGLIVAPSNLEFHEGDESAKTFTVKLSEPPLGDLGPNDVTVTIPSSFSGFLTTNPSSLTYTSSNWTEAQEVTLKPKHHDDDFEDEIGTLWVTANGGGYDGERGGIDLKIIDDDIPKLIVPQSWDVQEGRDENGIWSSEKFQIKLNGQLTGNNKVTVNISGHEDTDLQVSPKRLTFGHRDWELASIRGWVYIHAWNDADNVDDTVELKLTASGYFSATEFVTVTIKDNDDKHLDDVAGIVVKPAALTLSEGLSGDIAVSLAAEPTRDVAITLSKEVGSDLDWDFGYLHYGINWNTERIVKLTAGEDDDFENDSLRLTLTASGGGYDNITETVTVAIIDNDVAGLTVPNTAEVAEGKSADIKMKLSAAPSGNVTVVIAGHAGTDLTLDKTSLTFTSTTWNIEQSVTLTAGEDDDFENESVPLRLEASGGGYDVTEDVVVTITDNDSAGLIAPNSVAVTEGKRTDIKVKLAAAPSSTVTVTVTGHAGTDLAPDKPNLTFTTANWDTEQTVTLTAGEDDDFVNDSILLKLTASGGGYTGKTANITVTIEDNDAAGLTVPRTAEVEEGKSADIKMKLSAAPSGNVTVVIAGHAGTDLTLDKTSLTFTSTTWNIEQSVTLTAGEDDDFENESVPLRLEASGGGYDVTEDVVVTITDNDSAGLIAPNSVAVTEGKRTDIKVKLAAAPSSTVTVTVTGHAGTDLAPDKPNLTFTTANWDTEQTVTLTAGEDDDFVNDSVLLKLTASGVGYNLTKLITVQITDNDSAGLTVPSSVVVTEGGSTDIGVVLSAVPSGDVTIAITGHAGTDLSPDKPNLTFTTANWDTEQTVTLTAGEDDDFVNESVLLKLTVLGGGYSLTKTVSVTIEDNDSAGLTVPSSVVVTEGGSTDIGVVLSAVPSGDVTIAITGHAGTDLSPDKPNLTFTTANWDTEQTVTLTAGEDDDFVNESVLLKLTVLGGGYSLTKTVSVTIEDNDSAGLTVPSSVVVTEGGSTDIGVVLSAVPSGDVTIAITGHAGTDLSPDKPNLTFTTANWDTEQTLILRAGEDDDFVNESVPLKLTVLGGGYSLTKTVSVTIEDNDSAGLTVPSSVVVTEGGSMDIGMVLSAVPSGDVTIAITGHAGTDLTPDKSILTFTSTTWNIEQSVALTAGEDDDFENDRVDLKLAASGGGYADVTETVRVTIEDDDTPPTSVAVTLSAVPTSVDEGESVRMMATLSEPLPDAVTITLQYAPGEPPTEPGDYAPLDRITIQAGSQSGWGDLYIQDDDISEGEERLAVAINGSRLPSEVELGSPSSVEITILDDDPPPPVEVSLSAVPNPVDEGKLVQVTATLTGVLETDVVVPLEYNNATNHPPELGDYTRLSGIIIFRGDTEGSGQIQTIEDADVEDETFIVSLGQLPPDLLQPGRETSQGVTIRDITSSEVSVNLSAAPDFVKEGKSVTVTATLSETYGTDVTIPLTLTAGTADTRDYQAPAPVQIAIKAGERNGTYSIHTVDDQIAEGNETFTVALGALPLNLDHGEQSLVKVTITDDDEAKINAPEAVSVREGSTQTFDLSLTSKPLGDVVVTMTWPSGTDLDLRPIIQRFTPATWQTRRQVTLIAAVDEDVVDDQVEVLLTASGSSDYIGISKTVLVTITDVDVPGLVINPRSVTMREGTERTLEVALIQKPSGSVAVNLRGNAGTDLELSPSSLPFTTSDWQVPKSVTLTANEDDDIEDDTATLTLTASGGGYNGVDADVMVTITDNDDAPPVPLTISIYDRRELEDAGAIQLPIELSRPTDVVVTVQYASTDGTAESGLDYTASRGIVIFDPGATRGVIEIEITNDEIPESTETFAVTLLKPRNAIIARGTGTGTILDNDGGTAILRVEDALVQEEEGMVRFQVSLSHPQRQMISAAYRTQDGTAKAGEDYEAASGVVTLAPGTLDAMIAVPLLKDGLDWQEETFTVHLESSENAEIAKAVGVATIEAATTVSQEALEAYTARFVRTSATQVVEALGDRFRGADGTACGAATRAEMARLWYSASSWDPSLGELLGGCRMSATSYSGSFSVWGRGAFRQFNGREDDGLTLDGEVTTGMLGADYRWKGGWLAGVLLSHSQGEGSFAAAQESGEITAGLTGVYPYVSVARAGWEVWLSAGAGRGQAEVLELDGDLTSRFGAMGVRGTLVSNSTIGLNYHGDVLVTDAEIEEHAVTAEVYRVRAGVEANARINNVLRPYVEANVRSDGGSAETGVGLEFGGGMRIAYPAWRLKADVHAQGLVMHTAAGFSEWGISGFVQVGNRSEGLMMRVRPSWGLGQGMSLYGQQTIRDAAPMGTGVHRTELELGYGIPWKEGTARSIMGMTQLSQGRMYRLGGELRPRDRLTFSVFGLAHGRATVLGDIGVNVRGSLRY